MKLEVVAVPVSDVERATTFYVGLGWRRTSRRQALAWSTERRPAPGARSSSVRTARPRAWIRQNLFLIVSDIQAAHDELVRRGVKVSEVFHRGTGGQVNGPDPERRSYNSLAVFSDPDGQPLRLLQEITTPARPHRLHGDDVRFRATWRARYGGRRRTRRAREAHRGRCDAARLVRRVHGGRIRPEGSSAVRGSDHAAEASSPGGAFPDYELPHSTRARPGRLASCRATTVIRRSRAATPPKREKEHRHHLELATFYPQVTVAYTRIATISTDDHPTPRSFVRSCAPWTSSPTLIEPLQRDPSGYTDPEHNPMIPHTLVLKAAP